MPFCHTCRRVLAALALSVLVAANPLRADTVCLPGQDNPDVPASTPTSAFELGAAQATEEGIVLHRPTRLEWMRCALGQQWNGSDCVGEAALYTWEEALQAAAGSAHGGHLDWRLPGRSELASIVEVRCFEPAINVAAFPATPPFAFISATPHGVAVDPGTAGTVWMVAFDDGDLLPEQATSLFHVRLVRGGRWEP